MSDPLDKATGSAPPIIGSGCTQRYDPDQMGPELGTDFPDAEALWQRYRDEAEGMAIDSPDGVEATRINSSAG